MPFKKTFFIFLSLVISGGSASNKHESTKLPLWSEMYGEAKQQAAIGARQFCRITPSPQQVNFLPLLKSLSEFFLIGNCSNPCGKLITELINGEAASIHCVCTRFSDETDDKLSGDLGKTAAALALGIMEYYRRSGSRENASNNTVPEVHELAPSPQQVNFLWILKQLSEYFRSGNCSKACEMSITQLISGKAVASHCLCTRFSDKADDTLAGTLMGTAVVVHFWRGNITIPPPSSTTSAPKN